MSSPFPKALTIMITSYTPQNNKDSFKYCTLINNLVFHFSEHCKIMEVLTTVTHTGEKRLPFT